MSETLLFSVVIPTCQRNDLLAKCLDRLRPGAQTFAAERYEVIVSDDGSLTTAQQMVQERFPWARWVPGPKKGPAANRNNGARISRAAWLAFTDDDCLPEAGWLQAFAESAAGPEWALEGAIAPLGDMERDMAECPINLTGGNFWSGNIAIARSLFEKVGGFDSSFPFAAHEDQDLQTRLQVLTPIRFLPAACVHHPVRIVPLARAVRDIPKRSATLASFIVKNRRISYYRSDLAAMYTGLHFQASRLRRSLKKRHFKSAVLSLAEIFLGLPLLFWELRRRDASVC